MNLETKFLSPNTNKQTKFLNLGFSVLLQSLPCLLFNQVGQVTSVRVCRDLSTGRSMGYGYVNYSNPRPSLVVHAYQAKNRWAGKTIVDLFAEEFKGPPRDYYVSAIKSSRIQVDGEIVPISYIVQPSQKISHFLHRHEPPVMAWDVSILQKEPDVVTDQKLCPGYLIMLSLNMSAAKLIGSVAASFVIAFTCDYYIAERKIFGGTTPSTITNKEWVAETADKKFQAWPRTAGSDSADHLFLSFSPCM